MTLIFGIAVYDHASAVVLIRDGQIVAAASEERITRKEHDLAFPM